MVLYDPAFRETLVLLFCGMFLTYELFLDILEGTITLFVIIANRIKANVATIYSFTFQIFFVFETFRIGSLGHYFTDEL